MPMIHSHTNTRDSAVAVVTDSRGCEVVIPVLTRVMRVKVSWAQTDLRMSAIHGLFDACGVDT